MTSTLTLTYPRKNSVCLVLLAPFYVNVCSLVLALHHYNLSFSHGGLFGTLYTWVTKRVSRSSGRTRRLSFQGPASLSSFEIRNSHLFLILKPLYQISEERRSQWLFYIFYIWQTNMDVSMLTLPVHPTLSSLPSTLYPGVCSHVCVSTATLPIDSSVPSF